MFKLLVLLFILKARICTQELCRLGVTFDQVTEGTDLQVCKGWLNGCAETSG